MKKIKNLVVALMSLMVMFAFTGCMEVNENIKINNDGSVNVSDEIYIDKKAYFDAINEGRIKANGPAMTQKEMKEAEESLIDGNGYKLIKKDGKEYYYQKVINSKLSNKEVNKSLNESGSVGYVKNNVFYLSVKKYKDKDIDSAVSNSDVDIDLSKALKIVYKVQFPKEIKSVSGGKISPANKKVAVFEISYGKKINIFATTSKNVTVKSVKNKIKESNTVAKTKVTKKSPKKKSVVLNLKKVKGATEYEVVYSTNKNFKNKKVKKTSSAKVTIKSLKPGKKYYVKVRAVKNNYAQKYVYSSWTKTSFKTKK